MPWYAGGADRLNCFAAVAYIPEPLGSFLEHLRDELVPNCRIQSHVTVLPPRRIEAAPATAWTWLCERARNFPAFTVEATQVSVFAVTSVVHLAVGAGWDELQRLHAGLNDGVLGFAEPYVYHPHITLAQEISPDEVPEICELARRRWAEYSLARSFSVDRVAFVQNTIQNTWADLFECSLAPAAPAR